jgi:hypothetical protein
VTTTTEPAMANRYLLDNRRAEARDRFAALSAVFDA